MKLLICTQIVDSQDSNLGFFHRWIEECAAQCERVTVICLREGSHVFPDNVRVLSLGKESGTSRITRISRFFLYVWRYRHQYDAVLVHMNPEYVLLGGYLWRRLGKRIGLWYAHKSVTRKLQYAVRLLDRVFTVSEGSFRVETPKVCVVGHGIDTELFTPDIHVESTHTRIVTVGRVAQSKHLLEMLQTLDVLYARSENFIFTIVGEPTTVEEEEYARRLKEEIARRPYANKVDWRGAVLYHKLPALLREQDVLFNFATTGNMDKAGLEALAVGIPVIATNEAFKELLEPYGLLVRGDSAAVADALQKFLNRPDRPGILATLRNRVAAEHSLANLIPKILKELQ